MDLLNRDKLLSGHSIYKISWGEPKSGFSYTKGQSFDIVKNKRRISANISDIYFDEHSFYFYGKMIYVIIAEIGGKDFVWRSVVDIPVDIIYDIPNV